MTESTQKAIDRETLIALLVGFAVFLATIELVIPKPLPFLRLGIANLPILIALRSLRFRDLFLLVFIKIMVMGLFSGSLFSYTFLFSIAGGISSFLVMAGTAAIIKKRLSLVGISVIGAFTSNCVQLWIAGLLVFGEGAWFIAPPFLVVGTISSVLLGLLAARFIQKSQWVRTHLVMNAEHQQ
ncbi:MAG: Gx transporter family protein [Spirochaetales bacterium]|nr:Gx transporter family protein [Spirochaetales bacterium]